MKFFNIQREKMITFQVTPHKDFKNYLVDSLYKNMSDFYIPPDGRFIFGKDVLITYLAPIEINYKMYISKENISFFYTFPEKYKEHFKIKLNNVFDKATIKQIYELPFQLNENCIVLELNYKKHNMFSLNTDKDTTYPLGSICSLVEEMGETDFGLINVTGIPINRNDWDLKANKWFEKYKRGIEVKRYLKSSYSKSEIILTGLDLGFKFIFYILDQLMTLGSKKSNTEKLPELSNSTKDKVKKEILNTKIDLVVYSEDDNRKPILMNNLSKSYTQIDEDNELVVNEVETTKKRLDLIQNGHMPILKINNNLVSISEFRKLTQVATAMIQKEFPQVQQITRTETKLPEELFDKDGIPFCNIVEKGISRTTYIPIHDHDMLCMPHLAFGQMRVGKSEGFGNNLAYHFIMNGMSSFILETNDGLSLDMLRDALPEDYPDEKIIEVDLGNTMYPLALSWNDSVSRQLDKDYDDEQKEINQLIIAEKLTGHLKCFIDNLAKDEFSDRMEYYLTAAGRAVLSNPKNNILDVLLTLTSPSYRENLMRQDYIKDQPEVYQILKVLQDKTLNGSITHELTPIMTRLNVISGSTFIANLLLQDPKLDGQGKPLLDFRKYMDNNSGNKEFDKYGYCVLIRIPKAEFGGSRDIINRLASFIISKIWMCALSRIDISKKQRKPFVFVADEPHQYIQGSGELYREAGVESAKYRMKLVWMAHSLGQFGEFKSALTDGGCQITAYKTKSIKAFKELEHEFAPHDYEELYKELPKRWVAVNKILLPKSDDVPAFIGDMLPPTPFVKDRSYRRMECSKLFGRPFKEVKDIIQQKRNTTVADEEWIEKMRDGRIDEVEEKQEKRKVGRPAKRNPKVYK